MPALLSEEWSGVYLQVVVTLLVFALGIPALITQLTFAPDVHRVAARRRLDGIRTGVAMMCFYVFVAIVFIWYLHPPPVVEAIPEDIREVGRELVVGERGAEARKAEGADQFGLDDWSAALATTGLLLLTVLVWWHQIHSSARERLLGRLRDLVTRAYRKEQRIPEEIVCDIVLLGARGEAGFEKEVALDALGEIITSVSRHPDYRGDSLREPISGIEKIVAVDEPHANDQNFEEAFDLLKTTVRNLAKKYPESKDSVLAARTLARISAVAADRASENTVIQFLQDIIEMDIVPPALAARSLYEIGVNTLEKSRRKLALTALGKLEAVTEEHARRDIRDAPAQEYLLGLLAHLWTIHESSHERVMASLRRTGGETLNERLNSAIQFHVQRTNFATADCLAQLRRSLSGSK